MSRKSLTIALFVSLVVNVFAIGALAGAFFLAHRIHERFPGLGQPGGPAAQRPLWAAADQLPPEHRNAYRRILKDQASVVAPQVREARRARRAAWQELHDEPFDGAATVRDLAAARALEMRARGSVEERIVGFAATLPPQERAELAEGLTRMGRGARALREWRERERPMPPPPGEDGPP